MIFALSVPNKAGLWNGKPTVAALNTQFVGAYGFGIIGPYNIALPAAGVESPGRFAVWGVGSPKGRGFQLICKNEGLEFEVRCHLPATTHDLQDMFTFIALLAQFAQTDVIHNIYGDDIPVHKVKFLYTETAKTSNKILHEKAQEGSFTVTCLLLPIKIPESVCRSIANVPSEHGVTYFAAYLEKKQKFVFGYMAPQFYRDKDTGEVHASYILDENEQLIIPQRPFVPYGEPPFDGEEIKRWILHYRDANKDIVGSIDYDVFMERLRPSGTLPLDDDYCILKPVSLARMMQILS